ncbi:MAG TPA: tryptophanase [Hellea balneolensis]|uniref:Tryptophanase n=1 Tax=Hellea balneolensis TaxID=287478 RepID=A0A7C5LZC7_9PROT|nr:tryptophanase [Hellea balneolensis]
MKTIIEPFRIKSVEPIKMTTKAERQAYLRAAGWNLFKLKSRDVIIDLLTDSGTSAMSAAQWGAMMNGDESYAGSPSFDKFEDAIKELMNFKHIIPTHQGRAAEAILFSVLGGAGKKIPNNTHFDTTRGNIETTGANAVDLLCPQGLVPSDISPFKGNMDIARLKTFMENNHKDVPCVMITVTNNAGGGQPVSLANIKAVAKIARQYDKPFIIDGCRFAENAYFIRRREPGQQERSIKSIVREMFSYADGMTMSAKKDAFVNIGGWLALNDDELADKARARLIMTEGFPTYGGLAGRDLEAIAQGLKEVISDDYLRYRVRTNEYIVERLSKLGIPVVKPAGGHAVFIDARAWLSHISPLEYPGQSVACALYEEGGIRSCEIGTVMFGRQPDGSEIPAELDLVRLAMPRRVYTQAHADYIVEVCETLHAKKNQLRGFEIIKEPKFLRHFTAVFKPKP